MSLFSLFIWRQLTTLLSLNWLLDILCLCIYHKCAVLLKMQNVYQQILYCPYTVFLSLCGSTATCTVATSSSLLYSNFSRSWVKSVWSYDIQYVLSTVLYLTISICPECSAKKSMWLRAVVRGWSPYVDRSLVLNQWVWCWFSCWERLIGGRFNWSHLTL